jgi:hypothetical protein
MRYIVIEDVTSKVTVFNNPNQIFAKYPRLLLDGQLAKVGGSDAGANINVSAKFDSEQTIFS